MKTIGLLPTCADLDLKERVKIFLHQHHVPSLRHVAISVDNGVVRLHGRVRSFYEKQLCLSCCKHVAGVIKVVDDIRVEKRLTTLSGSR